MRNVHFLKTIFIITVFFALNSCSKSGIGSSTYSSSTGFLASSSSSKIGGGDTTIPSGVLTAGEWNDLEHWDFLQNLFNTNDTFKNYQSQWGFYCGNKWQFTIKDAIQKPVENVLITATDNNANSYSVRTNKFGIAYITPSILSNNTNANFSYTINYNGQDLTTGTLQTSNTNINYTLSINPTSLNNVDIMFVIDATGSMGDEIGYLKNELMNVFTRIDSALANKIVRYSAVFYRDTIDAYTTKPIAFTSDKTTVVNFVKGQSADGGGDYPEAVDEGLRVALQQSWSANAHAKILFLILDAPPHDNKMAIVREEIKKFSAQGITIIPVAASGTDKSTEFLLRFMAIATNGTYTFLTNDSGIGNPHIIASVGDYKVEYLNNLLVRLIAKYGS